MSQPSLLQRAKDGDTDAIAATINYLLKDQNVNAKVNLKNGCLKIILESLESPSQNTTTVFLQKLITKLGLKNIDSIKIYGKKAGDDLPEWISNIPDNTSTKESQNPNHSKIKPKRRLSKVSPNKIKTSSPDEENIGWRTLILIMIGLPLSPLSTIGTGLIALALNSKNLDESSYVILVLGGILLLLSVIIFAVFHLFIKFIAKITMSKRNYGKLFKYHNSLWEGLSATIILSLSSATILAGFAKLSFDNCQTLYGGTVAWSCAGAYTRHFALSIIENIERRDFIYQPWFLIWLVIVSFLYGIEYKVRYLLLSLFHEEG